MDGGIVGRRYAKALLNLASSNKEIEILGTQIQEVAELFEQNASIRNVMQEPKINRAKKINVIDGLTKKMECSDLINKYCRYLTFRKRFNLISDISSTYQKLANEKLGKATANIVVADKLTQKEEKSLQKQISEYTGKKITLSVSVNKSILGGAITSIGSLVLDGSIKNKLNLIRETISKEK